MSFSSLGTDILGALWLKGCNSNQLNSNQFKFLTVTKNIGGEGHRVQGEDQKEICQSLSSYHIFGSWAMGHHCFLLYVF